MEEIKTNQSMIDRLNRNDTGIRNVADKAGADEKEQEPKIEETKNEERPSSAPTGTMFECNICLDQASEPVVTPCGHLYCWKCIYEWMQQPRDTLVCPVCKSGISKDKCIPIFTRENTDDPR